MNTTKQKLSELEAALERRIKGQPEALTSLTQAFRRRELNTVPHYGLRGCYIYAGPTGVGKTESVKTIAEVLFGPDAFLRIDCSEYKTIESFTALLGDPSGNRGRLGRAYDRNREGIWLWDEIEKAHPELVQLFLQMADAGRLTLACGETLDLSGLYLVLTTNLGSAEIIGREHLTFTSLERHVVRCIEQFLSPELVGRFTRYAKPIVFRPLGRAVQAEITEQGLNDLIRWHQQQGRQIKVHPDVLPFFIYRGFSARLGARGLLGFIEKQIGNAVAENLMAGGTGSGTLVAAEDRLKLIE
ncbi:MAG TPA: AAA family ATPase [Verrucomicrobiota bacterium]|nr:AAA family ATPase [Verrucomicrobiota bacterium]